MTKPASTDRFFTPVLLAPRQNVGSSRDSGTQTLNFLLLDFFGGGGHFSTRISVKTNGCQERATAKSHLTRRIHASPSRSLSSPKPPHITMPVSSKSPMVALASQPRGSGTR